MSDRQKDKSFWVTLPGSLTGIAAVITAIATLVGVLIAAGYLGHVTPTPTPTPSPSPTPLTIVWFKPNPARPGDTVTLHLSTPLPRKGIVYFNGQQLLTTVSPDELTYTVAILPGARNDHFEIIWDGGHIRAPDELIIAAP